MRERLSKPGRGAAARNTATRSELGESGSDLWEGTQSGLWSRPFQVFSDNSLEASTNCVYNMANAQSHVIEQTLVSSMHSARIDPPLYLSHPCRHFFDSGMIDGVRWAFTTGKNAIAATKHHQHEYYSQQRLYFLPTTRTPSLPCALFSYFPGCQVIMSCHQLSIT